MLDVTLALFNKNVEFSKKLNVELVLTLIVLDMKLFSTNTLLIFSF